MKLFLYLPIFAIVFNVLISHAQSSKICSFGHNFSETEQYTLYPLKKENIKTIDSLLETIGVKRNFNIYHSNTTEKITSFSVINGKKNRYVAIPTHQIDSLTTWENFNIHNLSLLHAIGHHVNNHEFTQGSDFDSLELVADQYLGYSVSKMGFTIDQYLSKLNNALPVTFYTYNDPRTDERITSFKKGFNMFIEERNLIDTNNLINIFKPNYSKADSLFTQAKENVSFDFKLSASEFYKAYQYSNGKKIRSLYEAFTLFYKTHQFKDAVLCGNQLIYHGAGFLSTDNYITFMLELGESYKNISDHENALKILNYGQKLAPSIAGFPYVMAGIYNRIGDYNKRIEYLTQTLKNGPANVDLYYELAESYNTVNLPLQSIKYYKRILFLKPEHIKARIELANTYIKEGKKLDKQMNKEDISSDYNRKILKIKKELWINAENVLKEGLKYDTKNNILYQELQNLKKT
jgi:tetratricopeptide (TPR) repeat protein